MSRPGASDLKEKKENPNDEGDAVDDTQSTAAPDLKKKQTSGNAGDETESSAASGLSKRKEKASDSGEGGDETVVSAKAKSEDEAAVSRPEALDVAVGPRVTARSLTYVQDIYPNRNLRYSLPVAPMVAVTADFYPAALFVDGFAANLGLTADVAYLLPVVSTAGSTGTYGARSLAWSVGVKARLPMGVFATVAYGDQNYKLNPTAGATGIDIPATDYKFVRGGAGIRYLAAADVWLMANAAYLQCLSLGQIGDATHFHKGTGAAVEAGVAIGYRIAPMLEVRGGLDLRRYGLAFHQSPTDPDLANAATDPTKKVAGGAIDQYITTWVALAVVMDGHARHAGARIHGDGGAVTPVSSVKEHE